MTGNIRGILRLTVIFGLSVYLISLAGEAWATGPGGGGRAQPNVSRQGPARSGSFQPTGTRCVLINCMKWFCMLREC